MAEEKLEQQQQQQEQTDIEIAELANKEIRARDAEISKLKKELAQQKLYSTASEEEDTPKTAEDCLAVISDSNSCSYDIMENFCDLRDIQVAEGKPDPFGSEGAQVTKFLRDVIEECDGDKSRFHSIYQARLGADDPSIAMAYNKRKVK